MHPDMLAIRDEYEAARTPGAVIHFVFGLLAANTLELEDAYRRVALATVRALERVLPEVSAPGNLLRCMRNSAAWHPRMSTRTCGEELGEGSFDWTTAACFRNAVGAVHRGIERLDAEVFAESPCTGIELARAIGGAQNAFANAADAAGHITAWNAWTQVFRASVMHCKPPTSNFEVPGVSNEVSAELTQSMLATANFVREALAIEWPSSAPANSLTEMRAQHRWSLI